MKYIIVILTICLICLSACTDKKKSEQAKNLYGVESIKVDLKKEYRDKKFPNTNSSMTIQRLEESEKDPIGQIDKLIVDKNNIYILDRSKAKALFIYNRDGKLLHILNQTGTGPGEFTFPQDFDIDKKSGNIIVMDASANKFIFYSPKGQYLKEIKFEPFANRFILDNENNFIVDNGNVPSDKKYYYLRKLDKAGSLISNFFPSDTTTIGITFNPRNPFQSVDNKLFFLPTMSNGIYTLENDEAKMVYQIDFGKDWPSKEFFESVKGMNPLKIRERMFENNYICFLNCLQTKEVLQIDFYKEKKYSFYYNKNTKQSLLISMEDDNISLPIATYENEFIFVKYNETTGKPTIVFYTIDFNL